MKKKIILLTFCSFIFNLLAAQTSIDGIVPSNNPHDQLALNNVDEQLLDQLAFMETTPICNNDYRPKFLGTPDFQNGICLLNEEDYDHYVSLQFPGSNVETIFDLTLTNKKIWFRNNLFIRNNLSLINCEVRMDPGVGIFVMEDATLDIVDSEITSCNNQWLGIFSQENGNHITIRSTDSKISNATVAIGIVKPGEEVSTFLEGTFFNRNTVGVRVESNTSPNLGFTIGRLSGNTFDCTAPLLGTVDEISITGLDISNEYVYGGNYSTAH